MRDLSVALVGIGGWGWVYVDALLDEARKHHCRFIAAIDPEPMGCRRLAELTARSIPIFPSLEVFYARAHADLVIVASPIHLHCEHACIALRNGSHVLCEKPAACTMEDIFAMIAAREAARKMLAIGYQWSFSRPIQRLKQDIAAGRFGAPMRMATLVQWPRGEDYYARNRWAGRRMVDGRWVMDSPLNNACAHFVHNAFYILPEAMPSFVQAELYRANAIENFDTAFMRCHSSGGAEMIFCVTHAAANERGPLLEYEFEQATITYNNGQLIARTADETFDYGDPCDDAFAKKLWDVVAAIRADEPPACGVENAAIHTACMEAVHQSSPIVSTIPDEWIDMHRDNGRRRACVRGLDAVMDQCYRQHALPAELGAGWAQAAQRVAVNVPESRRGATPAMK